MQVMFGSAKLSDYDPIAHFAWCSVTSDSGLTYTGESHVERASRCLPTRDDMHKRA